MNEAITTVPGSTAATAAKQKAARSPAVKLIRLVLPGIFRLGFLGFSTFINVDTHTHITTILITLARVE